MTIASRYYILLQFGSPLLAQPRETIWGLDRWLAGAAALEQFPATMTMRYPGQSDWIDHPDWDLGLARDPATQVYAATQPIFPVGGTYQIEYRTKRAIPAVLNNSGQISSGVFKASHMRQPVWNIPCMAFIADLTDPDRTEDLLTILIHNGVGGDRSRGYGHLMDAAILPCPPDVANTYAADSCAWTAEGLPTRPIPYHCIPAVYQTACMAALQTGRLRLLHQRLEPPAWSATQQVLCLTPAFTWPKRFAKATDPIDPRITTFLHYAIPMPEEVF